MLSQRTVDLIRIGVLTTLVSILTLGFVQDASAQTDLSALAEKFSWREVGPANPGGRITDVEGVESAPHIIYIGTASANQVTFRVTDTSNAPMDSKFSFTAIGY